ncbi:low molecular weight phosphatase family protein [Arthrobacter sp. zg-Y820]|uniref:arsenate reductase/protein-tyrosine-phosphatase family protein n=1 Tax=unclassified Arthrobacter TaxID=235627 RepID=UPI001E2AF466|nr:MULTISPECIES: low molecular weight phosphatase family protein [unclassified Arthrobacter]MCC9198028.1 low molecular weight phosphatase family protein [Arthrobacter sp. zg-Y820]MDK1280895.1 low molecular weight phosphatase family protein [Arthrobacter sp. zg.Y820]WIB10373.1 low molecular weight phosphatase family protein [Arthrobacter sp. zg-Y820]
MTTNTPFRILTVCTGNICRSPMAERLLQAGFDAMAPGEFEVASAGTGALVGSGIEPHVAGFVNVFGGDSTNFASRQLSTNILAGQDLILALSRAHRSKVVELAPGLLRRTFTLRELARLLPQVDGQHDVDASQRWTAALSRALRLRSANPVGPEEDDVVDPYRRSEEVYQQMVHELAPAVNTLLSWERRHR